MECLNCGHETKNVKFCSRSCSVTFSNKNRKLSQETKSKISKKMQNKVNPEDIKQCHTDGLTVPEIVDKLGCTKTTVYKWLEFYGLEKRPVKYKNSETGYYCKCGETNPDNFYGKKRTVCSKCHNKSVVEAGKDKREHALSILGNKCINCDYNEFSCSLDIHHSDSSIKDTNFSSMRGWSIERIEKEIKSCVLLCRNCHSAYHSGLLNIDDKIQKDIEKRNETQ
ncbi:hypothetical protein [Yersinia phage fHe-Yen9-03]|uniref:Uncharacterized protein n=1 Tax=Yersinia phage fHe-Yen9-03 TaxID=2052743 RepID=A0A2C9CZJ6_9CAUD|nr:hypothetical protein [Yersinia phage fHe-Yen9-03]